MAIVSEKRGATLGHGRMLKTFANFHTHTFFSDGIISPDGLVDRVYQTPGLSYFALTDHDTLSGIEPVFRALIKRAARDDSPPLVFIPGIELSLRHRPADLVVHLIGLFPWIDTDNYRDELSKLDEVLGDYCRHCGHQRGQWDLDARVRLAYRMNLDLSLIHI